ncbi:MAG: Ni/Fe hydrogenase subunit alpha [Geobacteraceae bacterium]|nr:Ni/Fe hydrogenase subunit alpha [Geobacteraceae bacterium]
MNKTITIDPVTRIEGHAKVFINLADDGQLDSAGLVVNELRGFERILTGMDADRMPLVTARICGVCPTAHHLAASNALDNAAGVTSPPAAQLLRELMYMGHLIHSHCLSVFVLQGPDLVLGLDADPAIRNVVGVVQAVPEIAKKALQCRSIGQKINEIVGGRGTHPVTSVAGGIAFVLDSDNERQLREMTDEALALSLELLPVVKQLLLKQIDMHPAMLSEWVVPAWSAGTVQPDGTIDFLNGEIRAVDLDGKTALQFPTREYDRYLSESVLDWSYMKQVAILNDDQRHDYRVGPLARFNATDRYGTPEADREREEFIRTVGRPCHANVMQAYVRLIELVYFAERARKILAMPEIHGETRIPVKFPGGRGVGHVEAARGTLIHDYEIDENGIVRSANLIVATQQNYALINKTIAQAATSHVINRPDDQALLNAVEFGIRCYDPCLSCATHAMGGMPLEIAITRGDAAPRAIRRNLI